jgi:hypothetical protein
LSQEQHAFDSSLQFSTNPSNVLNHNNDLDFGLLTDFSSWDQGLHAANAFDLDPIPQHGSSFPTPELEFDYTPCLNISPPLFNNFFPSLSSGPASGFVTPSITNTPATTAIQSPPSPAPPSSPDDLLDPILFPGLKLPHTKSSGHSSKPGRRPAAASSSSSQHSVLDGRISKRSASPAVADADPEVVSRRARNNIAAKRYRQKKIDRIDELEDQVKEVTQERDDLRIRLARQEAEIAALREMLEMNQKRGSD